MLIKYVSYANNITKLYAENASMIIRLCHDTDNYLPLIMAQQNACFTSGYRENLGYPTNIFLLTMTNICFTQNREVLQKNNKWEYTDRLPTTSRNIQFSHEKNTATFYSYQDKLIIIFTRRHKNQYAYSCTTWRSTHVRLVSFTMKVLFLKPCSDMYAHQGRLIVGHRRYQMLVTFLFDKV